MYTKLFWKDAFERAVSTAAQAVLLVTGLSEDALGVINQGITWEMVAWAAGGGAALSLLKGLAAGSMKETNSASFTVGAKEVK
jgi:hypothetical protein